jgi:hypothetical protein
MKVITPDREREIQTAIEAFDVDWYINTNTHEICLKKRSVLRKFCDIFWKKKHSVIAMYWWVNLNWSSASMMMYKFPMTHDNMPIKGFPIKAEMQGGWTIPKSDLKFLKNGPLTSEGLQEILVPASTGLMYVFELTKQFAPLVTISAGLVTIATHWETVRGVYAHIICLI